MAFNPMANFQKYKKIWMASTILLCMVTFVLCSGFGGSGDEGGIGGWLKRIFQRKGPAIAEIDGSNYYKADFIRLKENREMANKYMRHLHEHCAKMIEGFLKNPEEFRKIFADRGGELTEEEEGWTAFMYRSYKEKLKQPRFFDGSYKLADLVDYQVWLSEADRLGIQLSDENVRRLIEEEGVLFYPTLDEEKKKSVRLSLAEGKLAEFSLLVQRDSSREASDDRITNSLRDEFRVQLAKLTLMEAPVLEIGKRSMPRVMLTPDQWWQVFKKNRNTFDVTLVPITVEEMYAQIKEPTDKELKDFFEAHKDQVEDVASDKTGLKPSTNRFVVRYLMADPKAPQFKNKAAVTLAPQVAPPVVWNPMMPPLFTYLNYPVADAIQGMVIEENMAMTRGAGKVREIFYAGWTWDNDYAYYLLSWMTRNNPQGTAAIANMASLGAGADAWSLLSAVPVFREQALADPDPKDDKNPAELYKHEYDRVLAAETKLAKDKMPLFASLVGLSEDPWQALIAGPDMPQEEDRKIPASLYREEEWDRVVLEKSKDYVRSAMLKAQRQLTRDPAIAGNPGVLAVNLTPLVNEFGLNLVTTKKAYTVHEMERAEELEPLKKAFEEQAGLIDIIEGRTKDKALSGKSFAEALFFTAGEKHSVEGRSYTVRAWPPDLETQQSQKVIREVMEAMKDDIQREFRMPQLIERLKHADPRQKSAVVPLFGRADNPILYWKEETPKDAPLRWETEITKELDRQLQNIKDRLDARLGRAKAEAAKAGELDKWKEIESNILAQVENEKNALQTKAKQEIQEVRERTLKAYKLTKARDELAPELARKIALGLAKTGGFSSDFFPYYNSLQVTGRDNILVREIAPWYKVEKGRFHQLYEYADFTVPKEVVFPRDDMAEKLLKLPWLESAYETGHSMTDALNKDLYRESKASFDKLKAEDKTIDKQPRVVQVLPNKPRTVYYVAVLTGPSRTRDFARRAENPPEPSFTMFQQEVAGFRPDPRVRQTPFLDKVYEEAAKEWRETVSAGLHRRHKLSIDWTSQEVKDFQTDSSAP